MSSITIIISFKDLEEMSKEACKRMGVQIPIHNVRLDQAVQVAKQAEKDGAQIIISRGTYAWKIKESDISIPVISIPITGYDMLRAYMKAVDYGGKIGVVDTEEVISGVESLESTFGTEIETYTIKSRNEMEGAVNSLIDKGIDVLIGKLTHVKFAQRLGVNTVILESGVESIMQTIREASNILEVRRKELQRNKQLRAILDFIADGVIAVDEKGLVKVANPAIEKILNISYQKIVGKNIDDLLINAQISKVLESGEEEINRIQVENGVKLITNRIPIHYGDKVQGVVLTFQELNALQKKEHEIRKKLSQHGHVTKYKEADIVGESTKIRQSIDKAKKYAKVDSTILLSGETGVGKEVFAHLIHNQSLRAEGPFVAVNCAAIPENLLESELFGYVEGAFTGAKKGGKIGLFELAHKGTIVLDEIGEMKEVMQTRLLRVLQEGEVRRLGDDRVIPVDVRVVTASNRNLEELISKGTFRADLYYRINVLNITVYPLRERKEDIPILCEHFITELRSNVQKEIVGFDQRAIRLMQQYHWPGNIRELRNVVERAMILTPEKVISYFTVLEAGGAAFEELELNPIDEVKSMEGKKDGHLLQEYEKGHILRVLNDVNGNKTQAAKILGIGRSTLWRKLNSLEEGDRV